MEEELNIIETKLKKLESDNEKQQNEILNELHQINAIEEIMKTNYSSNIESFRKYVSETELESLKMLELERFKDYVEKLCNYESELSKLNNFKNIKQIIDDKNFLQSLSKFVF